MSPGKHMARSLRQRYGSGAREGAAASSPTVGAAPTPGGLDKLKAVLGGKAYEAAKLKNSEKLIADAQGIAARNTNWLGALGATALASYGGYARDQEQAGKEAQDDLRHRSGANGAPAK